MAERIGAVLPDPVPDHPLLKGRKEIGRGENTIVLEDDTVDGQERVFKILSSPTDTTSTSTWSSGTSSPGG